MAENSRPVPLKRILFLGPTGAGNSVFELSTDYLFFILGKSKMINCCYNRSVDTNALKQPANVANSASCIGTTSSISNYVDRQNRIVYVDTIGYGDVRFHQDRDSFFIFFHELICHSSIGFNWIFLFLRFQQISEDTLIYFQTLQQLLGEKSLLRCTMVFTHCPEKDMSLEKFIEVNKQHEQFVNIIRNVANVIFGDMETENKHIQSGNVPPQIVEWFENQLYEQRYLFMRQMLKQIDQADDKILELRQDWSKFYWTKFKTFIGYCWEKIFRQSNELSKLYKTTSEMKEGILLMIFYQECSICLELIIEIINHTPKACITKCGHVFHYECLKKVFDQKKECPNCRTNLQSLPERISACIAGCKQVVDPLKTNTH